VHGEVDGAFVCIRVADTGSGIAAADLPRVFDPFFTTKDTGKGTGLGLSISFKIIEQHKGKILVHSRLGEGTTFTILLPASQSAAAIEDGSAPEAATPSTPPAPSGAPLSPGTAPSMPAALPTT
jgi:signal transduction histidine kinase